MGVTRGSTHDAPRRGERDGAVAIVGVALRFPGAATTHAYWDLLRRGACALRTVPVEELRAAGVSNALLADPTFVPVCGCLEDVDHFAAEAFGMTAREARLTAPQQRLLLEVVHELLVTTGYETAGAEQTIGIFAGSGMHLSSLNTYLLTQLREAIDAHDPVTALQVLIGNEADFAATRIAYRLGLTGPAVNVQTACSTSLVALHLACRALRDRECGAAVVAAGAVHVPHPNGYLPRKGSIMSPTGTCRAFDAGADGTVGGNGVAALLLKSWDAARADGDEIHAIVRGSAVNNDGAAKRTFAAPSAAGQRAVVMRALAAAGVHADTIRYVQAHGTGTPKGDPIEVEALTAAFRACGGTNGACYLGSVKPNIGHLDTCAGLAGLIAAMLALQHRAVPPQINYAVPNPELRLDEGPFQIPRELAPLVPTDVPLRASVSALGVGGTNAHVVLEAAA